MSTNSIVLIYSGGLDSTVLLYYLLREKKYEVQALSFAYGQKHTRELEMAKRNCANLRISHKILEIPLDALFSSTLLKTGAEIPEGHYTEESMKQTVVPMRNLIFSSIAAGYASSQGIGKIALAAHAGDGPIYPDCREEFYESLQETLLLSDWNEVTVEVPFIQKSKSDIVTIGLGLEVDFAATWTCYKGDTRPCEKCGSCTARTEAFLKNNALDPLMN